MRNQCLLISLVSCTNEDIGYQDALELPRKWIFTGNGWSGISDDGAFATGLARRWGLINCLDNYCCVCIHEDGVTQARLWCILRRIFG